MSEAIPDRLFALRAAAREIEQECSDLSRACVRMAAAAHALAEEITTELPAPVSGGADAGEEGGGRG